MTSRLKRKLGDIGIDSSSSKANESFCLIGTPLPPLEKSKDSGEFVPLWKQDVRDEQGRRRLHGAFTGGFSAGYFNTVGSKEGWTPSTFVSSRSDRAKQKGSRPEDFMDEEDLAELKEGRNLVDTNDEMDLLGGTQAELGQKGGVEEPEKDAITSALEASMLPSPKDSAGARILKKMGWRVGQGIGPRLTWRQRKLQDLQASTGSEVDVNSILDDGDTEEAKKHTYAPRDTPILLVDRKDNAHGLGYRPGMRLNDTLGVSKRAEGPKGPNLSAGFGLGALNDADEDDLDVYDGSFKQARRHMAYDASERDEDDEIIIGTKQHSGRSKPSPRSASSLQTFNNGRSVLAGFVLSDKPVAEDRWFPLPDIPKGWSPNPKRIWEKNKENVESSQKPQEPSQPVPHAKWRAGISADERGIILGETPLPSAPRSVFEYISQKDRERIQNIGSGAAGAAPSTGSTSEPGPSQRPSIVVPHMEPHIAQAALRGFQPFTTDPVKQARYTAYLNSQATPDPGRDIGFVPIGIIPGQKIDEFNKELSDYAKAAAIFKPISGAMAGRFTSAAVVDNAPKVVEGLHTPSVESENARAIAEAQAKAMDAGVEKEEETPKAHAARMGMYGRLTREVKPWQPAKLLCKRFGVKDPNPEPVVDASATPAPSSANPGSTDSAVPDIPAFTGTESFRAPSGAGLTGRQGSSGQGRKDPSNVGLGEDDEQGRDTLTYERPAMDIFKAIFASDEEDSDEDEDAKMDQDDDKPSTVASSGVPLAIGGTNTEALPTSEISIPATTTSHEPQSNGNTLAVPEKIDIASFKPTFIPRDGKKSKDKDKGKKDKKKKGERTIVSFDLDEDGGESLSLSLPKDKSKDRPKKKKRKDKDRKEDVEDDDESMWVEKPPPEAVKGVVVSTPESMDVDQAADRGRKKAIDFW